VTGKEIEVWFQDEARVGQKGSIEYVGAQIGSRPPMVRDNLHDSAHIFGAICPARGIGAAIIMPGVNAEAMNERLAEISTQVAADVHCLLVCDGAGWHQEGEQRSCRTNITLLPLPPYAPELNPMENVWDYLRGNKLSSLVWDSYEAMLEACKQAWLFLVNDPERIASIGTRTWACVKG
jgi:hypothetical protein